MRKKTCLFFCSLFIVSLLLVISGCKNEDNEKTVIRVSGIDFTPNCYVDSGEVVGVDVDIAATAMQHAGIKMEVSLAESWDAAYNATISGPNRALVTVGYSADRKDLFKWAGPTSQGMYYIFAKRKTGIGLLNSIDASKEIESIAVVRNWLETTTLENLGFQNLVYFNSYNDALNAFMNDQVKSIASDIGHLIKKLPAGYYAQEVEPLTRYLTVFYYIAFSKDVDDVVVQKCQTAIENMIKDRSTLSIMKNYLSVVTSQYIPGTIQLFTEVSPPFNYYSGSGASLKTEGSSTEIINEIQRRIGFVDKINITTWTDAYATALYLPNCALFSTARNEARENLFQWVGPISVQRACFYTLTSSGITILTLEQAKALKSIATPKDWHTHNFLKDNNFQNIVATSITPADAFEQLLHGEVEALFLSDVAVKWLVNSTNTPSSSIKEQMEAYSYKNYIAFSLTTPPSLVQKWQSTLDAMKSDGKFAEIWNKWFDGIQMP